MAIELEFTLSHPVADVWQVIGDPGRIDWVAGVATDSSGATNVGRSALVGVALGSLWRVVHRPFLVGAAASLVGLLVIFQGVALTGSAAVHCTAASARAVTAEPQVVFHGERPAARAAGAA